MDISSSLSTATITAPHTRVHYGRDMPEGSILCTVDCAADPLNVLHPVEKILEIIAARRDEIGPDKKLVVLMGELHSMPMHRALQALLMQRLTDAGDKFTMNFELPNNNWSVIASEDMRMTIPGGLACIIGQYDRSGHAALSTYLAYVVPTLSPVSALSRRALCHALKLPTCFNDAAMTHKHTLDLKDHVTKQVAEEYFAEVKQSMQQDIGGTSREGIAIRNALMARLALEHAAYHQANLILQSTGFSHVAGKKHSYPFVHSLYQQFTAEGAEVLAVLPTSWEFGLNNIPHQAAEALRSHVIAVDGLAEDEFGKYLCMNPSLDAEWAFLNKINQASGGKMDLVNVPSNRDPYIEAAHQEADALLARYHAVQKSASATEPDATPVLGLP